MEDSLEGTNNSDLIGRGYDDYRLEVSDGGVDNKEEDEEDIGGKVHALVGLLVGLVVG
ncbi:conserved hypothetical protein [Ricinus communis]|uniref:Uncharacterized protein n=1 Tax=Ricinus communis TaxID=3988 RepID=B9S3P1_RICCO|nr:conserved hypothetical protein [Ricinus communis]